MALAATIPMAQGVWPTPAQSPFHLYVNGVDWIANVDTASYWIDDPGGSPARFGFTVTDPTGTLIQNVALTTQNPPQQSLVIWYSAPQDLVLFYGWLKVIRGAPASTFASYAVECADISEVLDFTPILVEARPIESDQTRLQALLRNVPRLQSQSIGSLSASLGAAVYARDTGRGVLTEVLSAATGGDYCMDTYGRLTTYTGLGGPAAPYQINNDNPNNTTRVAAAVSPETDGYSDVDAVFVIGGAPAGTGTVWGSTRRDPARIVTINDSTSVDAASLASVGAAELARRQSLQRVKVVVEGWDGWVRGQVLTITDSRLGWTSQQFVIQGVSMKVVTQSTSAGTGYAFRRYELTCGARRPALTQQVKPVTQPVSDLLDAQLIDASGNILVGNDITSGQLGGLGAALRRYITSGVYNGDFYLQPPVPDGPLVSANQMPYWSFGTISGSSVTGKNTAASGSASGRAVQFDMAAGSAGDEAYIEQTIPINGSQSQTYYFSAYLAWSSAVRAGSNVKITMDWLRSDGSTTTGSTTTKTVATSAIGVGSVLDTSCYPSTAPPADAYFLRLRIGLSRGGLAAGSTDQATFYEVRVIAGSWLNVGDRDTPNTYGPGIVFDTNGAMNLQGNFGAPSGVSPVLVLDGSTGTGGAAGIVRVSTGALALLSSATQTLAAGTTISANSSFVRVSAAAPITLTSTPTVSNGQEGQYLVIFNVGANAITFQDQGTLANSNLRLSTATYAMGTRDSLTLMYSLDIGDWIEVGRSNVI